MPDGSAERGSGKRKIAVPVEGGAVATHFGHCEEFEIFGADAETRCIESAETVPAPPHQPGLLPGWLRDLGVDVIIAGGMGRRAQDLFRDGGIEVVVGASGGTVREVVQAYLEATLTAGSNPCDH